MHAVRIFIKLAFSLLYLSLLPALAYAQEGTGLRVLPQLGHSDQVTSVMFSPDGRQLLSSSHDYTLRLWDTATGRLLRIFNGHALSVNSAAFSPNGRQIISGSYDNTIKLWDVATGQVLRTFEGHLDYVYAVAFSPDGRHVLSGSGDKTLKLWDVETGKLLNTLKGRSDIVKSVAFSPDGRQVLSGGDDKTLNLWDVETGKVLRTFKGHSGYVYSVAFSPDGRQALSGSDDKTIRLWDVATGRLLNTLKGHSAKVVSVKLSPDGHQALSGSHDKTVKLWDLATGQNLKTFDGQSDSVGSVAFSPDGGRVVVGSGAVMDTNDLLKLLEVPTDKQLAGRFLESGRSLKLWDVTTGKLLMTFEGRSSAVHTVALSHNGRSALSGNGDGAIKLWDMTTGQLSKTFEGHAEPVRSVAFSPDDRYALSGSWDATVKLWEVATGRLLKTFEGHSGFVYSVAFSPDGRQALSGGVDGMPKLWDVETGKLLKTFKGYPDIIYSVAFSPDGRHVAAGGPSDGVKLWDVATGKLLRPLKGHTGNIGSIVFSPDGHQLLSGSHDYTLKLWDVATAKLVKTFERHSSWISAVAFSPDGRQVVSGSNDNTIKLWDVATGQLLKTLEGHVKEVKSLAFSPDGRHVLSGSDDGTIRLWATDTGQLHLTVVSGKGQGYLALTPAGFFAASGDGMQLLHVVRGLEVTPIDQLFEHLYRPDLVEQLLKGDPEGQYKDAASKLNLGAIMDTGSSPQIEHLADKDDRAGDSIRLSVRVTGRGGGVGNRIVWRVNGVTQGNPNPPELAADASPLASVVVTETLLLVAGQTNIVEVTAYNRAGLVATVPLRITVDRIGATTTERPRMFVLAVGVNTYRMKEYKLNYAAPDAKALSKALQVVGGGLFSDVQVKTLTDEEVSEAGVSVAIDEIARAARPDDVFVLFLAGHGKSIGGRYYYYPQALDFGSGNTVETNGLSQEKWDAWLRKIPAQKSVLIIDTCEGDAFSASRGSDVVRQTAMTQLQHATGRNVIAASRNAAYEGYQGHGVLTYALLEALETDAPDSSDHSVRVAAIADHIGLRVPEISQKSFGIIQNPTRKLSGNDFAIGIRQSVLSAAPEVSAIPKEATHVLIRAELVREKPAADAPGGRTLTPGTQVRAVEFAGAWVIVAREGQRLGYMPADALARLQ